MAPQFIYVMKALRKVVPPSRIILDDIWLSFYPGAKIGVLGPNGAGKSSLLSAVLGHMDLSGGSVSIDGSFAYVSQQAWIMNCSVKENILFGKAFDAKK